MMTRHATTIAPRYLGLSGLLAVVGIVLGLSGCQPQESTQKQPQPVTTSTIQVLYPPETGALVTSAIERFNAKHLPLANGSIAQLSGATFDEYTATAQIGSPSLPVSLWISPLSSLTSAAPRVLETDPEIGSCQSVMSTRLGVAVRPIDTFTLPPDRSTLSLSSVLQPQRSQATPSVIVGSPRSTSSGLLAALLAAAETANTPPSNLTPQAISSRITDIAKSQENVRSYFTSDQDALSWLAAREGMTPIQIVTTEQASKVFASNGHTPKLTWVPLTTPDAALDYPLCAVTTKTTRAEDLETAKLARSFFSSEEFASLASTSGFSPPASTIPASIESRGAATHALLVAWPQIQRPASTVFVIDTSIKTNRAVVETLRRELKLFADRRTAPTDLISIVSASSDQQVSREPTADPELIRIALDRLTTAGGNAVRDGIETAFNLVGDSSRSNYRRSLIVITSGSDTSSQTTVDQLRNRASQMVGRRDIDLFVIGLGDSEAAFGQLPDLTREVGGTFILADIASFPARFYPIARRVQ
jgi:hypothetical protein